MSIDRFWWLRPRRRAAVLDALRRNTELLGGLPPRDVTPYWYEERDHARAVAFRLLRSCDPKAKSDRTVA